MKKKITEQEIRDWYENQRVPPSDLVEGINFKTDDMSSLFSFSILYEWKSIDYKRYRIHWEGSPLISLVNELKANKG